MSELLANPKICGACNKPGCSLKCACKLVFYCGEECQRAHWPTHKKDCRLALAKKVKDAKREHGRDDEEVAMARFEAGLAHSKQGRYREAEQCFLEARRIYLEICGEGHVPDTVSAMLGDLYSLMGRYDEALAMQLKYLDILRSIKGERSQLVGRILKRIGSTLYSQGKYEEALTRLEEAQSILTETSGAEHSLVASVLTVKGNCLCDLRRRDEALPMYEEALRIHRIAGDDSLHVAASLSNIADILFETGMLSEARANYEEALGIYRRVHGEKHPSVATAFSSIASVLLEQGQHDEALEMHKKALKIRRRTLGKDHQDVAVSLEKIGRVHARQGKHDEAVEMYDKALSIFTRALGIDNRQIAKVHSRIALAKYESGDMAGALASVREAVRIFNDHGVTDATSQEAVDLLRELEASQKL